ncbi:hypothetical protein [Marivita sp. S2033]|uniref:hypothetical protein n=1 Tax=Marivita sp. S2033 TaxID=3373187 RepID=UPI003982C406
MIQDTPFMPEKHAPFEIDDAVDFYRQWPVLRDRAIGLTQSRDPADAELLRWMIKVIDMIGPSDLRHDS